MNSFPKTCSGRLLRPDFACLSKLEKHTAKDAQVETGVASDTYGGPEQARILLKHFAQAVSHELEHNTSSLRKEVFAQAGRKVKTRAFLRRLNWGLSRRQRGRLMNCRDAWPHLAPCMVTPQAGAALISRFHSQSLRKLPDPRGVLTDIALRRAPLQRCRSRPSHVWAGSTPNRPHFAAWEAHSGAATPSQPKEPCHVNN